MPKSKPKVKIEQGNISHDEMARYLMSRYTFKTFQDTKEILVYYPKTGRYQVNGDAVIRRRAEKTLAKHKLSGKATIYMPIFGTEIIRTQGSSNMYYLAEV